MFNLFKSKKNEGPEEDFGDVQFEVKDVETVNGKTTFKAIASTGDVGFEVIIRDTTSKVTFDENNRPNFTPVREGVIIRSIGQVSDNFLELLSELYKLPVPNIRMVKEIVFTSVALGGDPAQIKNEPVRFKLFFDKEFSDPESKDAQDFYDNEYFEVFLNIDLPNKKVEFNEKDIDYRKLLLSGFQIKQ